MRSERRGSARAAADIEFASAKAQLIRLRIAEKQRDLIPMSEATDVIEAAVGVMLTGLSGMAARCAGHDLPLRRRIEQVVFEVRTEIANEANRLADERGESEEPEA